MATNPTPPQSSDEQSDDVVYVGPAGSFEYPPGEVRHPGQTFSMRRRDRAVMEQAGHSFYATGGAEVPAGLATAGANVAPVAAPLVPAPPAASAPDVAQPLVPAPATLTGA